MNCKLIELEIIRDSDSFNDLMRACVFYGDKDFAEHDNISDENSEYVYYFVSSDIVDVALTVGYLSMRNKKDLYGDNDDNIIKFLINRNKDNLLKYTKDRNVKLVYGALKKIGKNK